MIRSLLHRVFGKGRPRARVYTFKEHGVERSLLSPLAQKVCDRLQQQGFLAFVVGGAVRDLLLGREPKDYDIATNATPEQVRDAFRRSRIIGRRFQIVHVMQGNDTVEVSTFRAGGQQAHTDEHGRILHDNVFGNQEEDALRRDFTANALYYNPKTEEIIDYHHGVADVRAGRLVLIGKPELRFREDPVRILRAVRLAVKSGLEIDPLVARSLPEYAELLRQVPPARLLDELIKVLECGASWPILQGFAQHGVLPVFMPLVDRLLKEKVSADFVGRALRNTDQRVSENKPVSMGFVFAALLWPSVVRDWRRREEAGEKIWPAMFAAIDTVLDDGESMLGIPRRYTTIMRELWTMQPRFEQRQGQRPFRLLEQERFRAAYDFLMLRAEAGEGDAELAEWWTRFQEADGASREELLREKPDGDAAPKRRRRRRRSGGSAPAAVVDE